jgi:sugar transferase (PEP-CTERM/EpsH1 system associated)
MSADARRTVLFISPKFPYPPDRGEKIRIWHVLRHLAQSHRVLLGCLVDQPLQARDRAPVAAVCAEFSGIDFNPRWQLLRAALCARPGRPLMLDYYAHAGLQRWIAQRAAARRIDLVYILSTAMLPYASALPGVPRILDMVDVDSEKWAAYGRAARPPASLLWAREARTLRRVEQRAVAACDRTLLVTAAECRTLAAHLPAGAERLAVVENGVDLDWYRPGAERYPDPYPCPGPWLTLVGNMDYKPNADAATWFAHAIFPLLRGRSPAPRFAPPRFAIVGANAGSQVRALASLPGVVVTGRVADVRPYLAHAAVVVAPLRIARGVQNKVLEGMAMARPVVASTAAFEGIRAQPGRDLLVAGDAAALAGCVAAVLDGAHPGLAAAAAALVAREYSWASRLAPLDALIASLLPATPGGL